MEEVEKRVLSRLRTQLVKEMVVTESFLSAFCQSDLLDEHLASGIRSEKSFEKRAARLLEILPSQSSRAFFTLMEILEITNPWLSEKMKAALHDERTKDAKINIHPYVAKSATIEGFAHSRLHIDHDIKERSAKFVRTNLYHLTEAEQRGVEKWMADELQRERRRQQFRAPLESRRQRGEFHSSKETQTETCTLDLREMFDELAIYLHGVDYDEQEDRLSFGLIQREVKELLSRTKTLDNLFLNCWNKFDDSDKYSQSLPDLIDRLVHHEKRLMTTEELNKQMINKLKDERDNLKRRVRRLEDDLDNLLKRTSHVIPPQELQLRSRQNVHTRYTFPYPADSNMMMEENEENRRIHSETAHNNNISSEDIKPALTTSSTVANLSITGVSSDKQYVGLKTNGHHQYNNSSNTTCPDKVSRNGTNAGNKSNKSHDSSHSNHVNGAGGHVIYRAEPIHFEERTVSNGQAEDQSSTHGLQKHNLQRSNSNTAHNRNTGRHGSLDRESDRGMADRDNGNTKTGHDVTHTPKLRRHTSEESVRIAVSREEINSTSTSSLNSDVQPKQLSVEDLPTAVAQQSKYTIHKQQQQQQQQHRVTRVDLQSRMQRMIASRTQNVKDKQVGDQQGLASGSKTDTSVGQNSNSTTKPVGRSMNSRDNSPSSSGKTSLQTSYDVIHNSKSRDINQAASTAQNKSKGNAKAQPAVQKRNSDPNQTTDESHKFQDKQGLFLLANRYNGSTAQENAKRQQVERYVQLGHPYRSFSSERLSRGAEKGHSPLRSKLNVVHPQTTASQDPYQHHAGEYSSDSELVLKPSSLRERTARSSKPRSRSVRFANPIARTSNPGKARPHRNSHYQMDTTSTTQKKIQK